VKRSTTAGSLNAPNTPNTRAAARTTSLGSIPPKSADPATAGRVPRRLAQWSATSAAFCGAMGHHTFGGERSGQARPALADVQHHVTRHPCDATPGPGKYHADGAKLSKETFSTYTDEAASVGRIRRSAVTGGMAWLGQASFQSRFAPPAPFSTPGPGAYDTQLSDFDALWRPCPPANASKAMVSPASTSRQGLSRQDHSVRGSTVVFGTATRSSAYPRGGQSEAARFGVHADRPPAATNYSSGHCLPLDEYSRQVAAAALRQGGPDGRAADGQGLRALEALVGEDWKICGGGCVVYRASSMM